jgi:hypothetical protein
MKSKSHLITAACVAALVFCGPSVAFAATKKAAASPSPAPAASAAPSAKPSASPKAPRSIPFHGEATAVDQSAKTFTIAGKEHSRVFKVTDKSTVTKDGKSATLADLTDNEKVSGSYWKQDDGTLEVRSMKIGGSTDAPKASKKAKKGDAAAADASPSPSPKK